MKKKLTIYCVTNKPLRELENLGLNLVGVGDNKFNDKYLLCNKGINIKIVQAFLQNNKNISLIGNYVNKLMERNKIIHPNIETFRFDVAYKAHEFIENPKKIGKSNIKI